MAWLKGRFTKRDGSLTDRYEMDTWSCHVCKDERPDDKISVFKHDHCTTPGGVNFTENVRYCNDRVDCINGAATMCLLGKPEEHC